VATPVLEQMETARQAALAVLKPSSKDLDHGLQLHADAVVCDAYGFGPSAAVDGDELRRMHEAGASDEELKDAVERMHATRVATDPLERRDYEAAWRASGVTCLVRNSAEEDRPIDDMVKRLAYQTFVTDRMGHLVRKAIRPADVEAAKRDGRGVIMMAANNVPIPQRWASVHDELGHVRIFYMLGVRTMHLTYNRRNPIGDGCGEPADAGLSDFGHAVVAEMNRVGVLVDVAHAGQRTSLEAARASSVPMAASHTVCRGLRDHVRGKTDEVIRAIADTGGYVGICGIPAFLGRSGDIAALLDHVDYAARLVGPDHVAIGTDRGIHATRNEQEMAKLPPRRRTRRHWRSLWPPDDPLFDPAWNRSEQTASLLWTNWPLLTVGLVQRGYRDEDIRKIIGLNVLRVARAVFRERTV